MSYHQFLDKGHPQDYRREEIEALARAIHARENRLLVRLPGVGGSNLLRFLVANKPLMEALARDVAGEPVTITFVYLGCETLSDPGNLDLFFEKVARQLYEQGLRTEDTSLHGYDQLEQLLTRMGGDPWQRVVIVIDNAEQLVSSVDRGFYQNLKGLTNYNKRVCFFIAVEPRTEKVVDPENLLFAGRRLPIHWLSARDFSGAIAEEARRLGVAFEPVEQERLLHLLGGHPGLLRAVSSAVVDERLDLAGAEATLIQRLLARDDVQARCQKVWDALELAEQEALYRLVHGRNIGAIPTQTLKWLQDFKLVTEQRGKYWLFSPLFQQFVSHQSMVINSLSAPTVFAPIELRGITEKVCKNGQRVVVAGKVFKGNQEVQVSPYELRLLACLKREQRIYTRDEIATYVYCEDEGINSDDAINALVSQVRRKLGDSTYIKAHYRQGYEFCG